MNINADIYLALNAEAEELFKTKDKKDLFRAVNLRKATIKLKEMFPDKRIVSAKGTKINGVDMKGTGVGASTINRISIILSKEDIIDAKSKSPHIVNLSTNKNKKSPSTTNKKSPSTNNKKSPSTNNKKSPSGTCKDVRPPLLAEKAGANFDPVGWWMSEKLDGNRAIWHNNQFCARREGKLSESIFNAPTWYKDSMPQNITIDGELWLGRRKLEETAFIRELIPDDNKWKNIKFMAFELPLEKKPFEDNQEKLKKIVKDHLKNNPESNIRYVDQYMVKNKQQMLDFFNKIISENGEGVMFRKAGSVYVNDRSKILLKKKPDNDSECEIIGYEMGKGRNEGRLGSFTCKWRSTQNNNIVQFQVSGMNDKVRDNYKKTHPIGTYITFGYSNISKNGKPTPASYIGIRSDMGETDYNKMERDQILTSILDKLDKTTNIDLLEKILNIL